MIELTFSQAWILAICIMAVGIALGVLFKSNDDEKL